MQPQKATLHVTQDVQPRFSEALHSLLKKRQIEALSVRDFKASIENVYVVRKHCEKFDFHARTRGTE